MADDLSTEKVRKTLSLTHKQAGMSAAGIAAFALALSGPLGHFFQSKEDGLAQGQTQVVQAAQIIELKNIMKENKDEIIAKINDSIRPIAKDVDRHETRIVNLEFIQMKTKGR